MRRRPAAAVPILLAATLLLSLAAGRLLAQALDGQRVGQLPSEAFELRMPGDIRCLERIEPGECAAELGGEPAHIGRDLG